MRYLIGNDKSKSISNKEYRVVLHEHKRDGKKDYVVTMMCLNKNEEIEPESHKYKHQMIEVTKGTLKGKIGRTVVTLNKDDKVIIPAGIYHHFWNEDKESVHLLSYYYYIPCFLDEDEDY